jgi:hypothetical protein
MNQDVQMTLEQFAQACGADDPSAVTACQVSFSGLETINVSITFYTSLPAAAE